MEGKTKLAGRRASFTLGVSRAAESGPSRLMVAICRMMNAAAARGRRKRVAVEKLKVAA